jgi:hypothetical protein
VLSPEKKNSQLDGNKQSEIEKKGVKLRRRQVKKERKKKYEI